MIEYITISSIGVSKESQFRAAKIIEVVCNGIQNVGSVKSENFFEYARNILSKRWQKLRETTQNSEHLILSKYPQEHCLFSGKLTENLSGTYVMFNLYKNALSLLKKFTKLIKIFCEFFIWEFFLKKKSLFNCIL